MYNRLETELGSALVSPADVRPGELVKELTVNPMIKVSGRSEIEDYGRISGFFEEFNHLAAAIAYAGVISSPEAQQQKELLQKQHQVRTGRARGQDPQKEFGDWIKAASAPVEQALMQDPQLLKHLKFMGDSFNPNGYDIVITPIDTPIFHFRGVVDKDWLRNEPQLLRSLYGGQSEAPWSMVGIVTHLPGTYVSLAHSAGQTQQSNSLPKAQEDPDNPMMLDSYRSMFRTARIFERMFLESNTDIEIVISPLAIYREFQVQINGRGQA